MSSSRLDGRFAIIGCPAYAAGHLSQVNAAALCSAIDKGEAEPDRLCWHLRRSTMHLGNVGSTGVPRVEVTGKTSQSGRRAQGISFGQGRKGTAHGRFYIMNLSEGGRMRSGVLDHEYSFSPEEAETWLDTHA